MRKHPLIALTAFTALGASAIAGATTGTPTPASTSIKAGNHTRPGRSARLGRTGILTAEMAAGPATGGGRDLTAHDLAFAGPDRLSEATGLLAAHDHHHPQRRRHPHHVAVMVRTTTPTTSPPPPPTVVTTPAPPPPPPPAPAGGAWYELRMCESGNNYAENTGNGYYGAYQFSLSTWYGLGYSGLPSNAPPAVQDQAAQQLQARSGWGQWPQCAAELGLT